MWLQSRGHANESSCHIATIFWLDSWRTSVKNTNDGKLNTSLFSADENVVFEGASVNETDLYMIGKIVSSVKRTYYCLLP